MKPKNILLSSDKKTIKLCDFGFAKHVDALKRVTTICGSPLYMAPELYKKESYTESVDIWSLGIILFEMVFGLHPFAKYNDVESLSASIIKNDIHIGKSTEVNENCLNLLSLMLKKHEHERINIDELFDHTWIKNDCNLTEGELSCMFLTEHINVDLYSVTSTPMSTDNSEFTEHSNDEINHSLNESTFDLIFEIDS
jgi:serine/threonine protein kinase